MGQSQSSSLENSEIRNRQIASEKEMIDVSVKVGVDDEDLQTFYYFEDINHSEFFFKGESLKGKYYRLRMKEFLNGELINTTTLFAEVGTENFKIDSSATSLKLISKTGKDEIKVWLRGNRFGSKKFFFPTTRDNGNYKAKDFFGPQESLKENINHPFNIMAIITPSRNPDGSASYCKVAQSEIDPENFGKEFNIPHFYLIEIEFVE